MARHSAVRMIVRGLAAIGIGLALLLAGGAPFEHGNYVPAASTFTTLWSS